MLFQEHLILDVKTTFRLQKLNCKNFWRKHIRNESFKCYLGNKEQKAMFLVVFRSDVHFGFLAPIFLRPILLVRPKNRAPRKEFVHPWVAKSCLRPESAPLRVCSPSIEKKLIISRTLTKWSKLINFYCVS